MKHITLPILVIAATLLSVHIAVAATVDPVDILIKRLVEKNIISEDDAADIRAEVANIRSEEEANKKSFTVSSKRPLKLSGYVQARFTHNQQSDANDTFEAKRVRLGLVGDATPVVDYNILVDFAGSKKALTDATKSASFGKPLLLDAVIGYKLARDNRISAGQFKVPFGLESLTSDAALDTINRSAVTEALVPGRDNGSSGRDIGLQFSGNRELNTATGNKIDYALGVFNGSGINVSDDNGHKDIAGRVAWKPGIEGLTLGIAAYKGASGSTLATRNRTGAEVQYLFGEWALRGEYIRGKDNATSKKGYYATLVRNLTPATQAVVRYDVFDPNTSKADDAQNTLTLGVNWFLNKDGYTRIQLNYERHGEEGTSVRNDQLLAQFQAGF